MAFPGGSGGGFNGVRWHEGQEYVFRYSGRLLTGLPELATQYAGVGIKAKVHVVVLNCQSGGPLRFSIKLTEVQYVRVNDKLHPNDGPSTQGSGSGVEENWRNLPLGTYEDLPSDFSRWVNEPTQVTMKGNGEFEHMVVGEQEPEWSINLKKGLIALFQTRFNQGGNVNAEVQSNTLGGKSAKALSTNMNRKNNLI